MDSQNQRNKTCFQIAGLEEHPLPGEVGIYSEETLSIEDESSSKRQESLHRRKNLLTLMQRFIECCEDEKAVEALCMTIASWADSSGDKVSKFIAESALVEQGLLPREMLQ